MKTGLELIAAEPTETCPLNAEMVLVPFEPVKSILEAMLGSWYGETRHLSDDGLAHYLSLMAKAYCVIVTAAAHAQANPPATTPTEETPQ